MSVRVRLGLFAVIAALLVGDLVALVAVGGSDARPQQAATATSPLVAAPATSPIVASDAAPQAAATDESSAATVPAASADGDPKPAVADRTPPAIDQGAFRYTIEVIPPCATRLQEMAAVVRAVPGAYVSIAVAYADAQGHGAMYAGPVGEDGTFTFRWTVPAVAAYGRGHALSAGRDPAAGTEGRAIAAFDIEKDASSC